MKLQISFRPSSTLTVFKNEDFIHRMPLKTWDTITNTIYLSDSIIIHSGGILSKSGIKIGRYIESERLFVVECKSSNDLTNFFEQCVEQCVELIYFSSIQLLSVLQKLVELNHLTKEQQNMIMSLKIHNIDDKEADDLAVTIEDHLQRIQTYFDRCEANNEKIGEMFELALPQLSSLFRKANDAPQYFQLLRSCNFFQRLTSISMSDATSCQQGYLIEKLCTVYDISQFQKLQHVYCCSRSWDLCEKFLITLNSLNLMNPLHPQRISLHLGDNCGHSFSHEEFHKVVDFVATNTLIQSIFLRGQDKLDLKCARFFIKRLKFAECIFDEIETHSSFEENEKYISKKIPKLLRNM